MAGSFCFEGDHPVIAHADLRKSVWFGGLRWLSRAEPNHGVIDRLVYRNYEPLVTLVAAAGATQRIRLMLTILIAPLRSTGVLAKQAASLAALSGGRLTLGLAVGGREDDLRFAAVPFRDRGRRFEEQLDTTDRGEERCTALYSVPTMFIAELAHPDFACFDLSSLRTGIMAGSPCPVEVMRRVRIQKNQMRTGAASRQRHVPPYSRL